MITAILEDSKGFRASMNFYEFRQKIYIPIKPKLTEIYYGENLPSSPTMKKMTFNFYKWLEKNKIALYREGG